MGNTEIITIEEKEFKVFKKIPVPIAREIQKLSLLMIEDYEGNLSDFEDGKVKPKDVKNIKLDILYEIYDLLLTKTVLAPKISKADIDNISHDFQEYFENLSELLFEKFTDRKSLIKKKSLK